MTVRRSVTTMFHWSAWRQWHQAWARYYHDRRRSRRLPGTPVESHDLGVHGLPLVTTTNAGTALPETIPEEVWQVLEHFLPPAQPRGRPYAHDRGQVLRGLIHVFQTGCGWRDIPATFPPAKTIYGQFRRWQTTGIWATVWTVLTEWCASGTLPVVPCNTPSVQLGEPQDTDERASPPLVVPETVWSQIAAILPTPSDKGRPYAHERRRIMEAILYKQHLGCGWRRLPTTYPPVKTVYGQFRRWQKSGHWDRIVALLTEAQCVGELQL